MNHALPLQTIHLAVQPCDDGLVSIQMQHLEGIRTVLHLDCNEARGLISALTDAVAIAEPKDQKPRIAVTLIRTKT